MFRIAIILLLLIPSVSFGSGYEYRSGYFWNGGLPYNRYVNACGQYAYRRYYPPAGSTINTTSNIQNYSYQITNNQAAASQGNTSYVSPNGVPSAAVSFQSYGALDLGATLDGLTRLSTDMQSGARDIAGDVGGLVNSLANVTAQQNQGVLAVAELEAKTRLLQAAQPSPQVNFQAQGFRTQGGYTQQSTQGGYSIQGGLQPQIGQIVTNRCANCHGVGGPNSNSFSLAQLGTLEGFKKAMARVTTDDINLRMPKGVDLDPNERGALIQELSRQ